VERFSGYERHLPLDLNTKRTDMGALREMSRAGSITPVMYLQTPDIDEELVRFDYLVKMLFFRLQERKATRI